jgi:two-component system, NtrC family, response regulator AtoC
MTVTTLLIVDDDTSILAACRMIFEGKYTVTTAENGSDAMRLLREEVQDVVILDIGLQDMSGIHLLPQIKSLSPETIVIVISASEDTAMINRARELGAVDYLVKPIDAKALKSALQKVVQRRNSK